MTNLIKNITWTNVKESNEVIKEIINQQALTNNEHVTNLVINNGNVSFTTYSKISYEDLVVKLIRKQYSLNEELAILRKSSVNTTDEFHIYNAYVEQCKLDAKAFIEERESVINE